MNYVHARCGGAIENSQCTRCHKKWSFFGKWFATDIRLAKVQTKPIVKKGSTSYAKWADNVKGVNTFASHLPNVPRVWRIVITVVVLAVLITAVVFLVKR
jgi:hypothetical protein